MLRCVIGAAALMALAIAPVATTAPASPVYRIGHVVDGDTVDLTGGAKVRLVQIDTPEVYFGVECYGRQASAITKRLLPGGTKVRLAAEFWAGSARCSSRGSAATPRHSGGRSGSSGCR
jgi:endonuclease YncB( thermonuclease family)